MTDNEWDEFMADACGIWGANPDGDLTVARIASWEKRWKVKPAGLFREAMEQLEEEHQRWPSVAIVHATINRLERREALSSPVRSEESPTMSPADRRKAARDLMVQVQDGINRTDGKGTAMTPFLQKLADLYSENANRSARGERVVWPPWKQIGDAPVGLDPSRRDPQQREREQRKRETELEW